MTAHSSVRVLRFFSILAFALSAPDVVRGLIGSFDGSLTVIERISFGAVSVVFALIVPAIIWIAAPVLSRFLGAIGQAELNSCGSDTIFKAGIGLIGVWFIAESVYQLLLISLTSFAAPSPSNVDPTMLAAYSQGVSQGVVRALSQLVVGVLLLVGAKKLSCLCGDSLRQ